MQSFLFTVQNFTTTYLFPLLGIGLFSQTIHVVNFFISRLRQRESLFEDLDIILYYAPKGTNCLRGKIGGEKNRKKHDQINFISCRTC